MSAGSGTGRIEAFSDGVFAIAITLLVIQIGLPHVEGEGTTLSLRRSSISGRLTAGTRSAFCRSA